MADHSEGGRAKRALLTATSWVTANRARKRRIRIAAALAVFQGTALILVANKLVSVHPAAFWAGLALILGGGFLLLARDVDRLLRPSVSKDEDKALETRGAAQPTMADKLLRRLTLGGRLDKYVPIAGIGVIATDLAYNRLFSPSPELLSTDFITLGLGAALVAFPLVPQNFTHERNFVLIFFAALTFFFAVPLLLLRITRNPGASVEEFTAALLAPQLGWTVNALGTAAFVNESQISFFTQRGDILAVYIATSCSGLYSMGIFISAFVALVLSEYSQLTKRVGALLLIGVGLAYLANLLRMTIIIEVGSYYGIDALLWTHANLGDIIFLLWVGPFIWITYRLLDPKRHDSDTVNRQAFAAGLRSQGIDPENVTEDDWFCATCFRQIRLDENGQAPATCPSCGSAM